MTLDTAWLDTDSGEDLEELQDSAPRMGWVYNGINDEQGHYCEVDEYDRPVSYEPER